MLTPNQIIILNDLFANSETPSVIKCPSCGEDRCFHGHGSYLRHHVLGCGQEAIPRFKCLNPLCRRKTFSILPFPFLRWVRHKLNHLLILLVCFSNQNGVSALARWWDRSRPVIRCALGHASQLKGLIEREARAEQPWALPWIHIRTSWTCFTQAASYALYPHLQIQTTVPHKSSIPK